MTRIVVGLPGAFGAAGGVQAYDRLLVDALLDLAAGQDLSGEVLLLADTAAELRAADRRAPRLRLRAYAGGRARFAAGLLRAAWASPAALTILGHVDFAPLVPLLPGARRGARLWLLTYGVEVWRPLGAVKRRALRRADLVVAVSEFTRGRLQAVQGVSASRAAVLPCALDPAFARRFPEPPAASGDGAAPLLLTVGRLVEPEGAKGVADVLEALPRVARAVPGVRYRVVGGGGALPSLRARADALGLGGRVEFTGALGEDELARAYAECALFVMPSRLEGFGIVFLEAGFCARPAVGARAGGVPEVIEDGVTGALVAPGDVAALAGRLVALLTDPGARLLGERARARVRERFSYARFRERLAQLLLG